MGTPEDDKTLALVGKVYDAALDEQKWPSFLEAFAQAVGGCSPMLRSVDVKTGKAKFVASFGYDPAWHSDYCNHFVKADYLTPAVARFKPGEAGTGEFVFSESQQIKTECFNDYLVPRNKPHVPGAFLSTDEKQTLMFAALRSNRAGAFGEEQARVMGTVAPRVTRAPQVHRNLSTIAVQKEWALGALDKLRMAVILTDSRGVTLFANRAAEHLMEQGNGISLCQGKLALNNTSETALLHKLIAGAAQGVAVGSDLRIALTGRFDVLHCLVTPLASEPSALLDTSPEAKCVAIFLSRPGSLQLSPKRLAVLYGLSPAESKLVARLAAFNSLEQAAKDLGVALSTARAQLGATFNKLGVKTQAELLMLLATGTLASCRDA